MSRLFASVLVLIFAVSVQTGYALECWKCSSDIDRSCRDPFNVSDSAGRGSRYYDNRYNDRQTYDPNNPNYNSNNPNYNPNNPNYNSNNPNYNPNNPNYNPNYNPNFPSYNSFSGQPPALERCDDNEASLRRMKNVCIKKTIRGSNYVSIVRRCAMVGFNDDVGTCHDPVGRGLSLEFCEYCDYDRCNSATGLKTNMLLAGALAVASVLFLRY